MSIEEKNKAASALLGNARLDGALAAFSAAKGSMERLALAVPPACFSPTDEQAAAVTAPGPATLVYAGAGCGKSSVIDLRLSAMEAAGVPMETVLCLSFTNAAADHLAALHPGIRSKTVASWTKERFEALLGEVPLAAAATFANIAQAFPETRRMADLVADADAARPGAAMELVDLACEDPEGFSAKIRATGIADLCTEAAAVAALTPSEPPAGISHVLVDEAQDNSAADLYLVLSFCAAQKASLYIVGDACQSLYEFRDASPETLLRLAASGVFEELGLTTNFRSAPEVLLAANALLDVMESNKRTPMSLTCPAGTGPGSARATVWAHRRVHPLRKDAAAALIDAVEADALATLSAGGTVGLLCRTNAMADVVAEEARRRWPGARVVRQGAATAAHPTALSRYFKDFGDVVSLMEGPLLVDVVERQVDRHLTELGGDREAGLVAAWASRARTQGVADRASLARSVAAFEASVAEAPEEGPEEVVEGPRVVCATVHGVKGLEYDCVGFLADALDEAEADLRADYVAITRARRRLTVVAKVHDKRREEVEGMPLARVAAACGPS